MASPIILPDYSEFTEWANQLGLSLGLVLPIAESEEKWKEWVASLFIIKTLGSIPNPAPFDNWRKWATYFINSYKPSPTK